MTEAEAGLVECYSGHTYAQEPRAFVWQGRRHQVSQVTGYWRTPDGPVFRVQAAEADTFELYYYELEDRWTIRHLTVLAP